MSTTTNASLACPACGHRGTYLLPLSANAMRHPKFRAQVLEGTFLSPVCTGCGQRFTVEQEVLYTDVPRRQMVLMFPRTRRPEGLELDALGARTFATVTSEGPGVVRRMKSEIRCRVVFGHDELREKIVCWDAGLDDRVLEALKVLAVLQDPAFAREVREGPHLVEVRPTELVFAAYRMGVGRGAFSLTRELYNGLARDIEVWRPALQPLFGGTWVHVSRLRTAAPDEPWR